MLARTHLASALFVNLAIYLPRKLVLIGTIIALLGATFLTYYSSCSAFLESLNDLVIDTESAARESLGILENDIVVEVNHSLARAASRTARALLNKIQSKGEGEVRRRLQGDVERTQ
ncbi:hypothetical protein C8J56DRAFT_903322 [Mycena floridula]|nr:hypothetical protein C8J56DRAFT_903322 [Mycena floridula]